MKYTGKIVIADDEGDTIFERELDDDEIVEAILAAVPDDQQSAPTAPAPYGARSVRHKCCGSKGWRHRNSCVHGDPNNGSHSPKAAPRKEAVCSRCRKPGHRKSTCPEDTADPTAGKDSNGRWDDRFSRTMFSEERYHEVSGLLGDDMTPLAVANELNEPLSHVAIVQRTSTYEDYREQACALQKEEDGRIT